MDEEEQRAIDRDWFAVDTKGRVREPDGRPRRRRPGMLGVLAGVVVLTVVGIGVVNRTGATEPPRPPAEAATSPTRAAAAPAATVPGRGPGQGPVAGAPRTVTDIGRPLLGVPGSWELYARGQGVSIRIDLARGRVTTTPVPLIWSTGPVAYVLGPSEVLIRPGESVPGYLVADGAPARALTGRLAQGGPVIPGPDPSHVWVETGTTERPVMSLVGLDGSPAVRSVAVPPDLSPPSPQSDGAGSITLQGQNGTYAVVGDSLHRVTTGQVLAASPGAWLVSDCDDSHRCTTSSIDRRTGARRTLGPSLPGGPLQGGAIAPDGRSAAVPVSEPDSIGVTIIDLRTGLRRDLPIMPQLDVGTMAWSPDSRWLLVVTALHTVVVVDPSTGAVSPLGVTLPGVVQLALRP